MNRDISDILDDWDYDPDDCVRIITTQDSREVLQVRQPMGIEQYELTGRPDGKLIFGKETLLEEYLNKLDVHKQKHQKEDGFILNHTDFKLLRSEGILFYYRYILLFQMGEFERTARDTEHNLKICELFEKYLDNEKDKNNILQHRPYIIRINAISNAMVSLKHKLKNVAIQILVSAIENLKNLPEIDNPEFRFERNRSISYLQQTLRQINEDDTMESRETELQEQLKEAIALENYEQAALLRDQLKNLHEKQTNNDKTH